MASLIFSQPLYCFPDFHYNASGEAEYFGLARWEPLASFRTWYLFLFFTLTKFLDSKLYTTFCDKIAYVGWRCYHATPTPATLSRTFWTNLRHEGDIKQVNLIRAQRSLQSRPQYLKIPLKKWNMHFLRSILKNLHLEELFYTDTVCGVCDKYQVCRFFTASQLKFFLARASTNKRAPLSANALGKVPLLQTITMSGTFSILSALTLVQCWLLH